MLQEKVLETIKKYNLIESGDTVIVGVSGGPDSICLLHVLNSIKEELNFKIYVAHVNHMIRKEADEETEYVQEFCKSLGVECFTKKADAQKIAKEEKKGVEETGRKLRYEFFNEIAQKLEKFECNENFNNYSYIPTFLHSYIKIATAHNSNDKIETIIMNILRGSGLSGLKGIEHIRDNKYIRPLIDTSRAEIENYCKENNLNPRYDKSNDDNNYTRNKIRNIIIPYIEKEFNPNILKTLNRLSIVAAEEDEYLHGVTKQIYTELVVGVGAEGDPQNKNQNNTNHQIILDLKKFNHLELVIKRRVILYTINELLGTSAGIEKINIDDIIKLCTNNIGNKYLSPIKNVKITIKKGKIFFETEHDLP